MADTVRPVETSERNTIKRRHWFLTINNYEGLDIESLQKCDMYQFQEEIGTNGTPHLQCYVGWKNPRSFKCMKDKFKTAHIEVCKNIHAARQYCVKMETRNGKIWSNIQKRENIIDVFTRYEPKEWQTKCLGLIERDPDERTIYWFWENKGCSGKTTLAKHICINQKEAIYVSGKASDIKFAISEMEVKPKIIIWDLCRSQEDYVSYQGIEEVKNGIFFSGKYKGGMVIYNNPHVIIFANFPPDRSKLSKDRWKVYNIPT